MNYLRNCPQCNVELIYKNELTLFNANKKNTLCRSCRSSKEKNPFWKKKHTEEAKLKISKADKSFGKSLKFRKKCQTLPKEVKILVMVLLTMIDGK